MTRWRRAGFMCLLSSVVLGSAALSGCMPQRVNLLQTGEVSLQVEAPAYLRLSATVYAEPNRLVVYGTARTRSTALWPIRGHIEIAMLGPDGTLLATQHAPYSRNVFRGRGAFHRTTFKATFAATPPPGSRILLRYHERAHEAITDHDDDRNDRGQ